MRFGINGDWKWINTDYILSRKIYGTLGIVENPIEVNVPKEDKSIIIKKEIKLNAINHFPGF